MYVTLPWDLPGRMTDGRHFLPRTATHCRKSLAAASHDSNQSFQRSLTLWKAQHDSQTEVRESIRRDLQPCDEGFLILLQDRKYVLQLYSVIGV